jgi:hypothetical protein
MQKSADAELFRTERSHSGIFKTGYARYAVFIFIFSFHTLKVKDGCDLYDDGYCIFANKLLKKFSFGIPDPILDQNQDL